MIQLLLTWLVSPLLWWRASRRKVMRRVLIIQTAKIGDFVSITPVFRALRMRLSEVEIVALVHPVNQPLAENLSSIDRVVVLPPGGFKGWHGKLWFLRLLTEGYGSVLVLSPNLATMLVPFWAGIKERVSVIPDRNCGSASLAYPFLTHQQAHISGNLFRETALRSLAGLGLVVDQEVLALPNEVTLIEAGESKRQDLFTQSVSYVGLGIGSGNRMKAFEPWQLLQLAIGILENSDAILVFVGTESDQRAAAELAEKLPESRVIDATGKWSLAELPSLLAAMTCFVGVDSGATYIADALGVPVVDYMGPADADDQSPIGAQATVIRSGEACAPCSHTFEAPYHCKLGTRACIMNANLKSVIECLLVSRDHGNHKLEKNYDRLAEN